MASRSKLDKQLDEIYGGDPAEFTKRRDALAKDMRKDGDDRAAAVKKLKRPTKAAGIINRISLSRSKEVEAVLKAGEELRKAQERLGKPDAKERLRTAATQQREAIDSVLALAADEYGATGQTLDRISETLQGTAGDEATADAVRRGRVEHEGQASGLGGPLVSPSPGPERKGKKPQGKAAKKKPPKRRREAAERKLAEVEEKLAAAEAAEREASERVHALEKELRTAKSTLSAAEKTLQRAHGAVERAKAKLDELVD